MKAKKLLISTILAAFTLSLVSCNQRTDISPVFNNPDNASALRTPSPKKSLIKIVPKDRKEANLIASYGIDILGSEKGSFDAYVTKEELQLLQQNNVKILAAKNSATVIGSKGLPGGYRSFQQVMGELRDLQNKYSDIATLQDIGDSWEKTKGISPAHDIMAFTIHGKNTSENKKTIAFLSGMHSRELAPVEVNMKILNFLLESYGKDPKLTEYMDTREIVFVPVVNPDGRVAVEKGDNMWRKNRRKDAQSPSGVDLNRNFDGHWNFNGIPTNSEIERMKRSLQTPSTEVYSGTGPFSEPETLAINNFMRGRDLTVMVDWHAYGEMVIWPPGYSNSPVSMTPLFKKIGGVLTAKNGYAGGTSPELLYYSCGTTKDWGFDHHKAVAFTIEMGRSSDGFRPAFSRVESLYKENLDGALYLISIADNPEKTR